MAPERIRLVFRSHVVWLDVVQGIADDVGVRVGFDEDQRFAVAMALREGVNNAIVHGNKRDGSKNVEVEFLTHDDRLEVRIRDQGPGFDVNGLPDPLAPQNLMSPGGRGVFLIRHYMDSVDLERAACVGGEIRMIKWRRAPAPA